MGKVDRMVNSELEIMKLLWNQKGKPMTSTEIRAILEPQLNWSKSTVLTLIRRLLDKGIIACEKKDVFYYTPLVSEDEFQKFQMTNFVNRIFDGNVKKLISALCQADSLNQEDVNELKKILDNEAGRK